MIDNGGRVAPLYEFDNGLLIKNHLSRLVGEGPILVSKYWEDPDPSQDGNVGRSINLYQDNTINYATSLLNLIHPSVTGSNTITCGLNGNLDIIRPSNGSSLAMFPIVVLLCPHH